MLGGLYNTTRENFSAATGGVFSFSPFPFFFLLRGRESRRCAEAGDRRRASFSTEMLDSSPLFLFRGKSGWNKRDPGRLSQP